MMLGIPLWRAAAIAGIVITALMIAGTISASVDDAWLWSLLSLYVVCLLSRSRRRARPWEQRWWWESPSEAEPKDAPKS